MAQMFKAGGPYGRSSGRYSVIAVDDNEDILLARGWFKTIDEALAGKHAASIIDAVQDAQDAVDDMSEPTRDELERKAKELGVGFNVRTSDETLAARIAEALA